jgi:hypothetical protein
VEVGISTPILEASFNDYGHLLTFCWIKILWQHLWKDNISVQNAEQVLPKLQQEGDFFIMGRLILSGGLTAEDEIRFNHCHLAYQAMADYSRHHNGRWIQGYQTCPGTILTLAGIKSMGLA